MAGLPANGRRRTPGLRREEVAQLAGVGLSWYTWLEQGRDIKPSAQVLDALARVLRLGAAERAHLFHLARVELPLPGAGYTREAPPELAAIVEGLAPNPAYLIGPRTDVLAWNRVARAILGEPARAPDGRPNLVWWLFTPSSTRSTRPARGSVPSGRAMRCSPSSSARRRSTTRSSARCACTTCSRRRRATPTCA
jgi:transcriptional regulator with XRE-family HTH domain